MKALTIWQPWATLIMAGAKPWEWRGWRFPDAMIGEEIVIHAGARPVRQEEIAETIAAIEAGDSSLGSVKAREILERVPRGGYALSHGLGTARLGTPVSALDWARANLKPGFDSSRIDHHKWGWPLTEIRPFAPPLFCKGAQGFWNWPAGLTPAFASETANGR